MPPADLLARERNAVFDLRRSGQISDTSPRVAIMEKWRTRVEEASTGNWTRRLIQDLDAWGNRKHGLLDFHLTKVLPGYGCFGVYLSKIQKEPNRKCHHCPAKVDDAAHTTFECPAWVEERSVLEQQLGIQPTADNLIAFMLSCLSKWEAVVAFSRSIMTAKEDVERERER